MGCSTRMDDTDDEHAIDREHMTTAAAPTRLLPSYYACVLCIVTAALCVAVGLLLQWEGQCSPPLSIITRPTSTSSSTTNIQRAKPSPDQSSVDLVHSYVADDQHHAILATGVGYSFASMYVFIRSLRQHCRQCQALLVVDSRNITEHEHQLYREHRIQLVYVDEILPLYQANSMVRDPIEWAAHYRWQVYYDVLRAVLDLGQHTAIMLSPNRTVHLNITHHFNPITPHMLLQARSRAHSNNSVSQSSRRDPLAPVVDPPTLPLSSSISHVFFCDVRDLVFHRNIFAFLPYRHQFDGDDFKWGAQRSSNGSQATSSGRSSSSPATVDGVWVFSEEAWLIDESINRMWVSCARADVISAGRPVLCSGTTLASVRAGLVYLDALLSVLYQYRSCSQQYKGFDQGAHEIAVYGDLILAPVYIVPNARGPVATMAFMTRTRQNEYGEQVNELDEVYAVSHQYDRHQWAAAQWKEQYHFIQHNLSWERPPCTHRTRRRAARYDSVGC